SVTVYAYIKGTLTVLNPTHVVLEAAGVGYEIQTPNSYRFQKYKDQDILIHTSLIVREDAQLLYGFYNQEEKDMFLSLIKVTGIGPKSALATLTVLNPTHVVLEAAGVGYEIQTPNSYRFQKYKDQDILIHTSLIVREDAQLLYGFYNQEEKDMFLSLIKVTGIGPKSALAIL